MTDEPLLQTYILPKGMEPSHLDSIDPATLRKGKIMDIDTVHRGSHAHSGTWQYIMSSDEKILLVRRSKDMVICPFSLSMIGEHSAVNETPLQTAHRCIKEELGEEIFSISQFEPLFQLPLYYLKDYGVVEGNSRQDRQLTYIWLVRLEKSHDDIRLLSTENEIDSYEWISINDLKLLVKEDRDKYKAGHSTDICYEEMRLLFELGLKRLQSVLKV